MSIEQKTVEKIAKLARIKLKEEAVPQMAKELNRILDWVSELEKVNTAGVEPLESPMASFMEKGTPWRVDRVTDGNCPEKVLSNAPEAVANMFVVPKVVE